MPPRSRRRCPSRFATLLLSLVAPAVLVAQGAVSPPSPAPTRPHVMILGTGHMNNPGRDHHNVAIDDVLAPARQAQLAELAGRLRRFRPTKIAIEAPWGDTTFDADYQRYRRGEFTLTRDERHQVAFRLARLLGHAHVYPIDYRQDMQIGEVMGWASAHGQGALVERANGFFVREIKPRLDSLVGMSMVEAFRLANSPAMDSLTVRAYLLEARIGNGSENPGAADVGGWYARNLHIFANLTRIIDAPDERVLVLFGAGHGPWLRQYVQASGDYELVAARDYLN
ncbi:MAG TPA: DUF5694 domain-containing protein [Gemmatimonadales bacterium]|nr:DUF5694 domain-containing protein [Gemmatimonadales bacterium]